MLILFLLKFMISSKYLSSLHLGMTPFPGINPFGNSHNALGEILSGSGTSPCLEEGSSLAKSFHLFDFNYFWSMLIYSVAQRSSPSQKRLILILVQQKWYHLTSVPKGSEHSHLCPTWDNNFSGSFLVNCHFKNNHEKRASF